MGTAIKQHGLKRFMHFNMHDDERGFTLVEMLVSISILSVIMAGMFSFLWGASSHWQTGRDAAEVVDNARLGLNRMTRELKQASAILVAQPDEVQFVADFGNGNETITYGFTPGDGGETGSVWRESSVASGELVLINDVAYERFDYYGNDYRCDTDLSGTVTYGELTACSADPVGHISRVDIVLRLSAGGSAQQEFVGQAWLRNYDSTGGL